MKPKIEPGDVAAILDDENLTPLMKAKILKRWFPAKAHLIDNHIYRWRDAQMETDQTFLGNIQAEVEAEDS
jgi:hypothetical protein